MKIFSNSLESNFAKFAALLVVDKRVYGAILSLFYLSMPNVETQHIGIILLLGCLAGFVFEIPSGYVADKIGHKNTIILSRIFMIISTLSYILSTNIYFLFVGAIFFSLAIACMTGSSTAFMYDTLKKLNREDEYSKIIGKASSIGYIIPTIFMMSASFLAQYDFKYIFAVSLVLDILGLIIAISLVDVKHSAEHKQEVKNTKFKSVFKEFFNTGFAPYAFLGAFIGGILIGIRGYVDPFQEFAGADIALFGVFLGLSRLTSGIISYYSGSLKNVFTINSFFVFRTALFSLLFIGLGFVSSWQGVVLIMILINTINLGLHEVSKHFDLELIQTSKFKATLLSIKSQIHQLFQALCGLALGFMVAKYSYNDSFMFLGFAFKIVCMICLLYIVFKRKLIKEKKHASICRL